MQVYLVRHGQSTHNANQDIPHNPDPPLTSLGREQARLTGIALREARIEAVTLYVSPHRRALETVAAIHEALGLPVHVLPDICEAGGTGEHTGICREAILQEWPNVTVDERITADGWWTGGLSEEEPVYYARAEQALELLFARHGKSDDSVILVSHGRFGSALMSTIMGHGPAGYHRYPFDNCGISRVDYSPHERVAYGPPVETAKRSESLQAVRLRFHNQNTHLPLSHRT